MIMCMFNISIYILDIRPLLLRFIAQINLAEQQRITSWIYIYFIFMNIYIDTPIIYIIFIFPIYF